MTIDNIQKMVETYGISNLDIEIWKNIYYADAKYQYQISNYGRFRNKNTGNIIKPYFTLEETYDHKMIIGRFRAVILTNDPHKTWKPQISRLVAINFVENPDPEHLIEVDHVDGNHTNNHYTNLEWVTPEENKRRSFEMKLRTPRYGEDNVVSIWKEEEIRFIWNLMLQHKNYHEIYDIYSNTFSEPKDKQKVKNLFYNLRHPSNPKWTHITGFNPEFIMNCELPHNQK